MRDWTALITTVLLVLAASVSHAAAKDTLARPSGAQSVISKEFAAQRDRKLDGLFDNLRATQTRDQARPVIAEIWKTWIASGNVDVDALMRQAELAIQEGGIREAFDALDRVIEIAPDYAEGYNRRATYHYMMGRHGESVRDIQKTLALEPRHFGALAGLGLIYMAREQWSGALKAFEKAAEVNPWLKDKDAILKRLREKVDGRPL